MEKSLLEHREKRPFAIWCLFVGDPSEQLALLPF